MDPKGSTQVARLGRKHPSSLEPSCGSDLEKCGYSVVVGTGFQIYFLILAYLFLEEYTHFSVDKVQPIMVFKMHCAFVSDLRNHQGIEDVNMDQIMLAWYVWCPGFPQHNN